MDPQFIKDFEAWYRKNELHFIKRDYRPDQIAFFAKMNNFPLEKICSYISDKCAKEKKWDRFRESEFYEQWCNVAER